MKSCLKMAILPTITFLTFLSPSSMAEVITDNLVRNSLFLNGSYDGWRLISGAKSLNANVMVDGVRSYNFMGGYSSYSALRYDIGLVYDESINIDLIKAGVVNFDFSVMLSSWSGDADSSAATVEFYNHDGEKINAYNTGWKNKDSWTEYTLDGVVDQTAVSASVTLYALRNKGSFNNGYAYSPSLNLSVSDDVAIQSNGPLVVSSPAMLGAASIGLMGLSGFAAGRRKKKGNT